MTETIGFIGLGVLGSAMAGNLIKGGFTIIGNDIAAEKMAAQRGEQMPESWMIDSEGNPLTDPTRADEGFLVPVGGYKGYGLALTSCWPAP